MNVLHNSKCPIMVPGEGGLEGAFSNISPRLLNRLLASLKELDSIATFKSKLKTFVRAFDLSDQSVNECYRL